MYVCSGDTGVLDFALRPQFLWVTLDVFIHNKGSLASPQYRAMAWTIVALSVEQVACGRVGEEAGLRSLYFQLPTA